MTDYRNSRLARTLDLLDEVIEVAYFVPLSVSDALALHFRVPGLKGLPLASIQGVLALIDEMRQKAGNRQSVDAGRTSQEFFTSLHQKFPEVVSKWGLEQNLWLDPLAAFQVALTRGRDIIQQWLVNGPENLSPALVDQVHQEALATIMSGYDHRRWPDDVAWRRYLRTEALSGYPVWARPGLYLEAWAEFVRGVMDLDPQVETRRRWPY